MTRVLFYCDVAGFGGHEIMALLIMREMIRLGTEIHFVCIGRNGKLFEEASRIEGLKVHTLPFAPHRYSFITNAVNLPKIAHLRRLVRGIHPDCIVAVQGNIEISALVLQAAKRENVPVVTYIALAQTMKELGVPNSRLRDVVHRHSFMLPDRFITIGESQKLYLLRHGVTEQKISIVPNVAPLPITRNMDRASARHALGIEPDKFWFGLAGRVFANHKGHDYLVTAAKAHKERFAALRFLIVGDGPDLGRIQKRVKDEGLGTLFTFKPWTDEMHLVYAALDAVIIPSNHEGVPLVMIEAGLFGLPVIASEIDGMKDYLPPEWLFPRGDVAQMAKRMIYVSANDQFPLCDAVKSKFSTIFLRQSIGEEFIRELSAACANHSGTNRFLQEQVRPCR